MLAQPQSEVIERLRFLSPAQVTDISRKYGTPVYVYSQEILITQAESAKAFPAPFGLTVRYAMKANPLAAILQVFHQAGLHIDASSGNEVQRAIKAGFEPSNIMLTSQQLPDDLASLVSSGVIYNATSLRQLETYGKMFPGTDISVRLNMGLGSGHTRSVSVAGPTSSFGIWHEQISDMKALLQQYKLNLTTIHSHIGCGTDPEIWTKAAQKTLHAVEHLPSVQRLNLGGGFKIARMSKEHPTDLQALGRDISQLLIKFQEHTGRRLHLEIEPGTFLMANAGTLLASVQDIVSTGPAGFTFLKLNTGMNDILRPALHGSQHPIITLTPNTKLQDYVVVGHNCESTDLLTPSPDDSEIPLARSLPETAIGDVVAIEGVGAYCSSMRAIGYNSFATPNEVLVTQSGEPKLINRSVSVAEFTASEVYS